MIGDQLMIYRFRATLIRFQTESPVLSGRFIKLQDKTKLLRRIPGVHDESSKAKNRNNKIMRQFKNISDHSGIFLGGAYPHWIFCGQNGRLK
jgi:hypothetical protein